MWFVHAAGVALHRWRLRRRTEQNPRRATLQEVLTDLDLEIARHAPLRASQAVVVSSPLMLHPVPVVQSSGPILVIELPGSAYDAAICVLSLSTRFLDLQVLEVLQRPQQKSTGLCTRVTLGLGSIDH